MFIQFIPTIIILLIVGSIIFVLLRAVNYTASRRTGKKQALFFNLYVSILVVSALIYIVLPTSKAETLKEYTGDYEGGSYFYDVLNGERPIEQIASFKHTDNTFPLKGSTLHVSERSNEFYSDMIDLLIIKDPSLQSTFRVETYVTPAIIDGKDITPHLQFIDITADDESDRLVIHLPSEEISIKMYDYAFPYKQFLGERRRGYDVILHSRQLAIIYIPTDVEPDATQLLDSGMFHVEMRTIDE